MYLKSGRVAWRQCTWSARLSTWTVLFKLCSFDNKQPLKCWENIVAPQAADSANDTRQDKAMGSFVYSRFTPSRQTFSTVESSNFAKPLSTVASASSVWYDGCSEMVLYISLLFWGDIYLSSLAFSKSEAILISVWHMSQNPKYTGWWWYAHKSVLRPLVPRLVCSHLLLVTVSQKVLNWKTLQAFCFYICF